MNLYQHKIDSMHIFLVHTRFLFFSQSVFKLTNETLHLFQHFRTWRNILSKTSVDLNMRVKYLQYHIDKYQLHVLNIVVFKFRKKYRL